MKKTVILFLLFSSLLSQAQTVDFYVNRGDEKHNLENYKGAIALPKSDMASLYSSRKDLHCALLKK